MVVEALPDLAPWLMAGGCLLYCLAPIHTAVALLILLVLPPPPYYIVKRRIQMIRTKAEIEIGFMRTTFSWALETLPEHIKHMPYKEYLEMTPTALENADPNVRRQSSKLFDPPTKATAAGGGSGGVGSGASSAMAPPAATPMRTKSALSTLQTPAVRCAIRCGRTWAGGVVAHACVFISSLGRVGTKSIRGVCRCVAFG